MPEYSYNLHGITTLHVNDNTDGGCPIIVPTYHVNSVLSTLVKGYVYVPMYVYSENDTIFCDFICIVMYCIRHFPSRTQSESPDRQ